MSQLDDLESQAPPEANPAVRRSVPGAPRGPLGFVWQSTVMGWRWLVRMRTALYLLGVLAIETLLATVIPQEPNVPGTVRGWLAGEEGPGATVAALIDTFGLFDVYGSTLFLATLFLLYLSLTACMIPRVRAWVRLVRRSVPPRSRYPDRSELATTGVTDRTPDEVHAAARELLDDRRWRVRPGDDGPSGPPQVAAEKGLWSREGGSLLFHLSFYVLLAAVVFGQLSGFTGQVGVVEGEPGFADAQALYWTRDPGRLWSEDDHAGWTLELDAFTVDWVRDPLAPGAGQPTTFASDVTVTSRDGEVTTTTIEGNAPVTFEGMKVTQLDWGYAPRIEVVVDGEVVHDGFVVARAESGGLPPFRTAVKAPSADPDLGLDVFIYPFAPDGDSGSPELTGAPWDEAPVAIVRNYRGDLQLGRTQQSVWQLDTSALESSGGAFLRPGSEVTLDGDVTIRFHEMRRWVGFQVSNRPQLPWLLLASVMLLGGLWPALYAYRRRLWVAASTDPASGRTLVTVGGRAFQRPQAFEEEHEQLVRALADATDASPVDPAPRSTPDATTPTVGSPPARRPSGRA
ncbi:cytochrome c biogenesis protein ResB [Nitriliruptor alkaliphilus]|uniref:cytochrome c biogenesis protein ResB n=1 Tax=Nitriliruptor alkaliphilus TaxID=427918 RepID=UPI00069842E9|nr:cytochrome c biogenesis protein ResB [Nitriliruptor alkaliphilus]